MRAKIQKSYSELLELYKQIDDFINQFDKPCERGCSYCCHQVISVFNFEKPYVKEAIRSLKPEIKAKVLENYKVAKDHFMENSPDRKRIGFREFQDIYGRVMAADYISCPLLVNNECSIYDFRPLECRWHFVRYEPIYCAMNRIRDACEESIALQAKFVMEQPKDQVYTLEMLLMVVREVLDRKGDMKLIEKVI